MVVRFWAILWRFQALVGHREVETRRTAKRILTVADLPREVATVSWIVGVWDLYVVWKAGIYLRYVHLDVRNRQVTALIIVLRSVVILVETLLSRWAIHSSIVVLVELLILTLTTVWVLSKNHYLFSVVIVLEVRRLLKKHLLWNNRRHVLLHIVAQAVSRCGHLTRTHR